MKPRLAEESFVLVDFAFLAIEFLSSVCCYLLGFYSNGGSLRQLVQVLGLRALGANFARPVV
jgi:hypothetical protein